MRPCTPPSPQWALAIPYSPFACAAHCVRAAGPRRSPPPPAGRAGRRPAGARNGPGRPAGRSRALSPRVRYRNRGRSRPVPGDSTRYAACAPFSRSTRVPGRGFGQNPSRWVHRPAFPRAGALQGQSLPSPKLARPRRRPSSRRRARHMSKSRRSAISQGEDKRRTSATAPDDPARRQRQDRQKPLHSAPLRLHAH